MGPQRPLSVTNLMGVGETGQPDAPRVAAALSQPETKGFWLPAGLTACLDCRVLGVAGVFGSDLLTRSSKTFGAE